MRRARASIFRVALIAGLSPILAIAGYLLLAAIGGAIPGSFNRIPGNGSTPTPPVYLTFTPIHADFAIPVTAEVKRQFAFLSEAGIALDNPNLKYLIVGWGSRAFYKSAKSYSDIGFRPVWTATTGDASVIHVQPAGDVAGLEDVVKLDMPAESFSRLTQFIVASFDQLDGVTTPIDGATFGQGDVFYPALGRFHIFRPCNVWVTNGLRQAGFGTGFWTPTTYSLRIGHFLYN